MFLPGPFITLITSTFGFNVPMGPTPSPSPAAVSPSGEGPQFPDAHDEHTTTYAYTRKYVS
uniref:Uncharacterized protein n=1 Tax=Oryza glumipatula TaxID=40148 RepID=A0A0E0A0Y8_9ORYZ